MNFWQVADQQWFADYQHDTEAMILGRLAQSHQDGVFSHGGLPGYGTPPSLQYQYEAYLKRLTFQSYSEYESQIGGQGILFSVLDRLIPLPTQAKLRVFYALTSFLSAVSVTAIVLWFHLEFGLLVGLCVVASSILSQWLVVFGRNLWWSIWAFYVPMVVIMFYIRRNSPFTYKQPSTFAVIAFIAIFIKCVINGYEYITTTLMMMMVPFVYYAIRDKVNFRSFLTSSLALAVGSGAAILLSLTVLCFQIASITGSPIDGVNHIVNAFQKRTYGNPNDFPSEYSASLQAGTVQVVVGYIAGTSVRGSSIRGAYFDVNNYLNTSHEFRSRVVYRIRYLYLICLVAVATGVLYGLGNAYGLAVERQRTTALMWAAWFSILAPLSWFVVFKAHSYLHEHMNYIVWQMPFTMFGSAVCGMAVRSCFSGLRLKGQDILLDGRPGSGVERRP
jgi:hypothetical protein